LSKYLLAVTIDDPASITPPDADAVGASDTKAAATPAATGTGEAEKRDEDAPAAPTPPALEAVADGEKAAPAGKASSDEANRSGDAVAAAAAATKKTDPSGPKCVELKMKPDWYKKGGGNKRRRGNLENGSGRDGGRHAWPEGRPEYCRFVLYKENSDTMGAVSRFCKHFRFPSKIVGYAGTKDKRGVTSQWCTVRKKSIEELRTFNRPLGSFHQGPIVLVGNFSYVAEPLKLGNLGGNRFGIVLRNLTIAGGDGHQAAPRIDNGAGNGAATPAAEEDASADGDEASKKAAAAATAAAAEAAVVEAGAKLKEIVDRRCTWVKERGFINYFGLQRFGSGGAPTSEVGLAMLKEDWQGAVKLIMTPRLGENEATHQSKVHYLKNPTDIQGTLNRLPFFMDAEKSMMQALLRGGPNAHVDALKAVPKNLQLMYL
ncbi:unnamed protein product, partial [Hapterophycus canaliculatus]